MLASLAVIGWRLPPAAIAVIDWQPGLVWPEAWRALSAVAVHYSGLHLAANLAGAAAVGALGWAARLPARCTLAWVIAWPLTQFGLLLQPTLQHFGGLSGVLHAGVAVAAVDLLWRDAGLRRAVGAALLVGLAAKVLGEAPWGAPLRSVDGWDIALAPASHASGAALGSACAVVIEIFQRRQVGSSTETAA